MNSHILTDGVELNNRYPSTFHIPSDSEKARVQVGDNVKLRFEAIGHNPEDLSERMWVEILELTNDGYKGFINNDPVSPNLKYKQEIEFEARHIMNIYPRQIDKARLN
jgi:uncharacterized protein YegJ (DUF2314 family)